MPCPAAWFSEFSELVTAAEVLRVSVPEVDALPLHYKLKALAFSAAKSKARPFLEDEAKRKAQDAGRQKKVMDKVMRRPGA